ncbi:Protein traJ [Gossypium arboreum]|uniref:Protein traJ n=1 Tax=Gossypium arboreum TaxID=29729 RepID=A0A0B0PF11_GOSAR|nr:Protein traJ [Gossypium arboreum]
MPQPNCGLTCCHDAIAQLWSYTKSHANAISQIWSYMGSHIDANAIHGLTWDLISMLIPCPRHGLTWDHI